jgi:esterase/lipase
MDMIGRIHEPSGAEHRLLTANIPFEDYVAAARKLIIEHRVDLNTEEASTIIEANSPFEWRPYTADRYKRGVLLVHGLFDCPFSLRDIGAHFLKQGYLVRAILLPGHGTVPGDLLNIDRQDWRDTVANAISSMSPIVDNLYIVGFSMGAALSLLEFQKAKNLRAMILVAPGIKSRHPKARWISIIRLSTWISKKAKWYQISNQKNYTKYNSHSYNPAYQTYKIMKGIAKLKVNIPLFFVASEDDETIDPHAVIRYFLDQSNPNNQMILYTKNPITEPHSRIEQRSSSYPDKNIIDFSHSCLPISPSNPYLGEHGKFLDFSHYHNEEEFDKINLRIGAISTNNLIHHTMQRLSYNPDFDYMVSRFSTFIENLPT